MMFIVGYCLSYGSPPQNGQAFNREPLHVWNGIADSWPHRGHDFIAAFSIGD
jgi:hypothetical protein